MAESDGTPSPPHDGDKPESGAAPAVPVAPAVTVMRANELGADATRAALRKTLLQAGVDYHPAEGSPQRDGELQDRARRVSALADTHQDLTRTGGVTQPPRASRNPKLGRTLRMDLKVPPGHGSHEPSQVVDAPAPSSVAARAGRPQIPTQHGVPLPPIQPPDGRSARPYAGGSQRQPGGALDMDMDMDARDARDTRHGYAMGSMSTGGGASSAAGPGRRSSVAPAMPRKRPLRPGERTMVLSRRRSGRKDWLFVVLVVGALGVTASMLLSYRGQGTETEVAEGEPEVAPEDAEQAPEDTSLQAASDDPTALPTSSAAVRATELRSEPAGAEVVVNGAVVGNTPVRVARADSDVDYTLRLPGYESKVVRVGSRSPATISVTLRQNGQ